APAGDGPGGPLRRLALSRHPRHEHDVQLPLRRGLRGVAIPQERLSQTAACDSLERIRIPERPGALAPEPHHFRDCDPLRRDRGDHPLPQCREHRSPPPPRRTRVAVDDRARSHGRRSLCQRGAGRGPAQPPHLADDAPLGRLVFDRGLAPMGAVGGGHLPLDAGDRRRTGRHARRRGHRADHTQPHLSCGDDTGLSRLRGVVIPLEGGVKATMRFVSDNNASICPEVLAALSEANRGLAAAYGNDPWTGRLSEVLGAFFGTEVRAFVVATGTAANSLALSVLSPPYGSIYCHPDAHIVTDECGAPGFFTSGAQLELLGGANGKL